jgi:predicted DsbA family dithiol-disulfide isomerase
MVHDIVCSWRPIGYTNIATAISNLNNEVDFHFIPFELTPNMAVEGELIVNYFHRQIGWNNEELPDYQASLISSAAKSVVSIDFSKRTHYYHTEKARNVCSIPAFIVNENTLGSGSSSVAYFEDTLLSCLMKQLLSRVFSQLRLRT